MSAAARVLVIKLGALGDFVQATGPFAAIRARHAQAHLTLLTTPPFAALGARSPWFDAVLEDTRPRAWQIAGWWRLGRLLAKGRFDWVYDLQTSDRSALYFRLLKLCGQRPRWSGIAPGCSHPHANPERDHMHTLDRQAEQLAMAGIDSVPHSNLDWVVADTARFGLSKPYVLLVPGGSATRPEKRWPAACFADLAKALARQGAAPVLLGTEEEAAVTRKIAAACRHAVDLTGRTGLTDIVALGREAAGAVGNDTGPMHMIALSGAPAVVLFSQASDPALCAPRGLNVAVLQRRSLADLDLAEVEAHLRLR